MVRIVVCKDCGLSDAGIRRELKRLRHRYGGELVLKKKDCLDACKRDPAVKVGKKLLAPATPKKLRRALARKMGVEVSKD